MKVFISWSGERSRMLASGLRDFLPIVIQAVRPFMSEADIEAGSRWPTKLNEELGTTDLAVLCLTPENVDSNWIHYEAGALSKNLDGSRICTCLFQLAPSDVKWPLAQFQASKADKDGIRNIVETINSAIGENRLSGMILATAFNKYWPDMKDIISRMPTSEPQEASEPSSRRERSDRELLQEMLQLLRGISRGDAASVRQAMFAYPRRCLINAESILNPSKNEMVAARPKRAITSALDRIKEARRYVPADYDSSLGALMDRLTALSQIQPEGDDEQFWDEIREIRTGIRQLSGVRVTE